MKVRPNTSYVAILRGAPEGLVGTLTVGMVDALTGADVIAQSAVDIVELAAPSGNYSIELTVPADEGEYLVMWVNDDVEVLDDVVIEVRVDAPIDELDLEASYASRSDLAAYLEDGIPDVYSDEYLDKVLVKASKDIDLFCNYYPYTVGSDLKFASSTDPFEWGDIYTHARGQIVEAVCAQAEYRLAKGDQFFVEIQRAEGEFANTQVYQPRIGPKAKEALQRSGLEIRRNFAKLV